MAGEDEVLGDASLDEKWAETDPAVVDAPIDDCVREVAPVA